MSADDLEHDVIRAELLCIRGSPGTNMGPSSMLDFHAVELRNVPLDHWAERTGRTQETVRDNIDAVKTALRYTDLTADEEGQA